MRSSMRIIDEGSATQDFAEPAFPEASLACQLLFVKTVAGSSQGSIPKAERQHDDQWIVGSSKSRSSHHEYRHHQNTDEVQGDQRELSFVSWAH